MPCNSEDESWIQIRVGVFWKVGPSMWSQMATRLASRANKQTRGREPQAYHTAMQAGLSLKPDAVQHAIDIGTENWTVTEQYVNSRRMSQKAIRDGLYVLLISSSSYWENQKSRRLNEPFAFKSVMLVNAHPHVVQRPPLSTPVYSYEIALM